MYILKVDSLHYTGLPNFPRAMLIRVMALEKKNSIVQRQPEGPPWLGPREKVLILESLDRWKMHF